jgi:hypothetical protein
MCVLSLRSRYDLDLYRPLVLDAFYERIVNDGRIYDAILLAPNQFNR